MAIRALQSRALLVTVAVTAIAVALATGERHDYILYVREWRRALHGGEPWLVDGDNAYGPLFLTFAPLASLHHLLPKLVFVAGWLALGTWLRARAGSPRQAGFVALLVFLNPFFWVQVPLYGHFDVVVAGLVVAGVAASERGRAATSGALIALGTLLKFVPAIAVPFLAPTRQQKAVRLAGIAVATVTVGFAVTTAVWGTSWYNAVRYAGERAPKILSIFSALNEIGRSLGFEIDTSVVSLPLMVVGVGFVIWLNTRHLYLRPAAGAATAMLLTFILYKVGHPQFHVIVVVLLAFLLDTPGTPRSVVTPLVVYALMLALFDTGYVLGDGYGSGTGLYVRRFIGLPATAVMVWLLFALIRWRAEPQWRRSRRDGLRRGPVLGVPG